jgi:hypothetical protein
VAGAVQKSEYLSIIKEAGFEKISVQKEKKINLPDEILKEYLDEDQMNEFKKGQSGIVSVTVYAEKPDSCCGPGCCK